MTASTPMLHGSDLDECCSNVFALVRVLFVRFVRVLFLSHVTVFCKVVTPSKSM